MALLNLAASDLVKSPTSLLRYLPDANRHGTDTFSYTVTDIYGEQATGLITVVVASINDAPIGSEDYAVLVAGDEVTLDVLANDGDAEDDELSVSAVTDGAHGTVSLNTATNAVTYEPTSGSFVGSDAFSYIVTDGAKNTVVLVHIQVYEDAVWADSVIGSTRAIEGSSPGETLGAPDNTDPSDLASAGHRRVTRR